MTAWSEYSDRYGLTPKEAKLFAVLADGKPHSRDDLALSALGLRFVSGNLVAVHISRMRTKLAAHAVSIETERGTGAYRAVVPDEAAV